MKEDKNQDTNKSQNKSKDKDTDTAKVYTREELIGRPQPALMVIVATIGLLGIAAGTLLPILNVQLGPGAVSWWKYVYAGGAFCFLVGKLLSPYTGTHPRVRRLFRIEAWSAVFFCVAAFFLFFNGGVTRDSWAFTLAGGVLLVFTTIAIPKTINRQLRRQKETREKR